TSGKNGSSPRGRRAREQEVKEYDALIRYTSAIVLIAAGILLGLSLFGAAGPVGQTVFTASYAVVGIGAFLLPLALIGVGLYAGFGQPMLAPLTTSGLVLTAASVLAFAGLFPGAQFGGKAGTAVGELLAGFFGFWGAFVLLSAIIAVGIAIATDIEALVALLRENVRTLWQRLRARGESMDEVPEEFEDVGLMPEDDADPSLIRPEREPVVTVFNRPQSATGSQPMMIANFDAQYEAPPLSLLGADRGKPGTGDIKANANIIKRTFQNFGIHLEMDEVSVGPTVTRYAVKPAEGVRLSKIVSLANNLELALAAHPVRIEAPIPGKSLVGIEVPNTVKAMVGLGGILSAPEWTESTKPLIAALGRDIAGTPHYLNIPKMPHALVAGATGSG
ncbi:MAG: DNA translocase FtsK, partial [Sulfuricaulis sp.]|nr:DNA translocase FtsK [Sulfuricaulis sp.]